MNVNYPGSLAERRMNFSSSVEVNSVESSDLFNGLSVYVPMSFANANIIDFDGSEITKAKPQILVCTVDNYADILKGDLLAQLEVAFRQGSNFELMIFIVVFVDVDEVTTMWEYGTKSISFEPLTTAFRKFYFLSFVKLLFDPTYDGEDVTIPGTFASGTLTFTNGGASPVTLAAGGYSFSDGTKTWAFTILADQEVAAGASFTPVAAAATTVGPATLTGGATVAPGDVSPVVSTDFTITVATFVQGTNPTTRASTYFDLALAMAYLAKSDNKLSTFWAIAKVSFDKIDLDTGVDTNKCGIRAYTAAQEQLAMTSLVTGNRTRYFYGALYLMGAVNTTLMADCENRNVHAIVLAEWFGSKNGAGEYVGNKLSLLRLTNQRCFGPVSDINALYNAGDTEAYDRFDEKNVGSLCPISASNTGDSYVSMYRGITGIPINAIMISKKADYDSSQACADMITDKGTLTDPVLTDELTYRKVQNITIGNIAKYGATRRISAVVSLFPSFSDAKTGSTKLSAASAWKAWYTDDLDEIEISGGIIA